MNQNSNAEGQHAKPQRRKERHVERLATKIWEEEPARHNPFLAASCRCHGYDLLDLARKRSFTDVIFLLFAGDLPTPDQSKLLETLYVGLINPGPRHPATRAAMNAGVGRTAPAHVLPISLSVLGGNHLGASEVEESMRFLRKHQGKSPLECALDLLSAGRPPEGDWHLAPGFGSRFGGIDPMPGALAKLLLQLPGSGKALRWAAEFTASVEPEGLGWLSTGVAAAGFCDLGLHPRLGAGLFQLAQAPGLLAHGMEFANQPVTAMPFPEGENYVIRAP